MKYGVYGIVAILIFILAGFGIFYLYGTGVFDKAVKYQEEVDAKWADVQSSYQRRADLIGNLVETVKGAADFEQETLTAVVEARAKATSIQVDPATASPEELKAFEEAQGGLKSALGRLLVTVERYPELKATEAFMQLQAQLEGTENRINTARDRYNEAVKNYNSHIRGFWKSKALSFVADEPFEKRNGFEASAEAQEAPKVNFGE
jgi:LemA protein